MSERRSLGRAVRDTRMVDVSADEATVSKRREAFVLSDFLDRWSRTGFDQPHQICSESNTDHRSTARYRNGTAA